jgi:hypothetical protein
MDMEQVKGNVPARIPPRREALPIGFRFMLSG